MSHLYGPLGPRTDYWDKKSGLSQVEWLKQLRKSTTVYVGNLSFYTTEDQIYELFSKCGDIVQVVVGLNRKEKSPCGFCFVQYASHAAASRAVELLNNTRFDERKIRVDWDTGNQIDTDRKFGRGDHGLQWRDEFRKEYDPGRGGAGGGLDYATFCSKSYKARSRYQNRNRQIAAGFAAGPYGTRPPTRTRNRGPPFRT